MEKRERNLYRLHELSDYKVASDYPDVRGWKIIDADNNTIGKIDDLIVNKATERVVYLDVEVDEKLVQDGYDVYNTPANEGAHEVLNKDGENHVIIPIGSVNIDEDHKHVLSDKIRYDTFRKANRFEKGSAIEREYEVKVFRVYFPEEGSSSTLDDDNDDFYSHSHFERRD